MHPAAPSMDGEEMDGEEIRARIKELLTCGVQSAEESFRTRSETYRRIVSESNPEDPEALQSVYQAARELRMARKRCRRAARALAVFGEP